MRYYIYDPDTHLLKFVTLDMDEALPAPENSIPYQECSFRKPGIQKHLDPVTQEVIDITLVEMMTEEEMMDHITTETIDKEYALYLQRRADGLDAVLRLSAELRVAKLAGVISDAQHTGIEIILEPVRAEVVLGQWIGGRQKLEAIDPSQVGQALYDRIMNKLNEYIILNY